MEQEELCQEQVCAVCRHSPMDFSKYQCDVCDSYGLWKLRDEYDMTDDDKWCFNCKNNGTDGESCTSLCDEYSHWVFEFPYRQGR